jgi:hypothetical protein
MWELIVVTSLRQQKLHSEGKICILNKKYTNNVAMQNNTINQKFISQERKKTFDKVNGYDYTVRTHFYVLMTQLYVCLGEVCEKIKCRVLIFS